MARAIDAWKDAFQRAGKVAVVGGIEMHFDPLCGQDVQRANAYDPKSDAERGVYLLIVKAKDAEGKPLFQVGDFHDLMHNAPLSFVNDAIAAMYEGGAVVTAEEAKAALGESPASTGSSVSHTS